MLDILKQFEAFLVIISLLLSRQSMVCKNKTEQMINVLCGTFSVYLYISLSANLK